LAALLVGGQEQAATTTGRGHALELSSLACECGCAHRAAPGQDTPAGPSVVICRSTPGSAFAGTPSKNNCPARARAGMTTSWAAAQSFSAGGGTVFDDGGVFGGGGRVDVTLVVLLDGAVTADVDGAAAGAPLPLPPQAVAATV